MSRAWSFDFGRKPALSLFRRPPVSEWEPQQANYRIMVRVSAVMGLFILAACAWKLLSPFFGVAGDFRDDWVYVVAGLAILGLLALSLYVVPQRIGEELQIGTLIGIAFVAIYLNFVDPTYVYLMGGYSPLFAVFLAYPLTIQYLESGPPVVVCAGLCIFVIMGNCVEHALIETPGNWKAALSDLPLLAPLFFLGLFIFNKIFWEKGQRLQAFNALILREHRSLESLAALGVSIGTITHDMKGRLSFQKNIIELLRGDLADRRDDEGTDDRIRACADLLARSCAEMEAFSEDIRSRVLAKSVPESEFDLRDILRGAVEELVPRFGDRILCDLPEKAIKLWGSPFPYFQIVSNLARNSAETGSTTRLSLSPGEDGRSASIEVSDRGAGIASCMGCIRDHGCGERECGAFEIGKTTKSHGSGVGMISVFGNLEHVGGSLRIESGSQGTTMYVSLPIPERPSLPC